MPEPTPSEQHSDPPPSPGADLVRAALDRARAAAAARRAASGTTARADASRSAAVRRGVTRRAARRRPLAGTAWSEPVLLGDALGTVLADRGWDTDVKVATVLSRWPDVVGPQLAAHCRPVALLDGTLELQAESTAWATQLRLLQATLLEAVEQVLGAGVVRSLVVRGPVAPSWQHGLRRVRGRGARDTYG